MINKSIVSWELMWKFITIVLIGVFLVLIGIFNFYNWSNVLRYSSLIGGIVLAVFGLWRVKEHSKG